MSEWLSVVEMANKTGIPHQTLRRYMASHSHLLKVKKVHKAYQIHEECIDIFNKMREMYSDGKTQDYVDKELASTGLTVTIDVPNENGEMVNTNVAKMLAHIQGTMSEQGKLIQSLTDALSNQKEELQKRDEFIQDSINKRDKNLLEALRGTQEAKKIELETVKPMSFWEKLKFIFSDK